MNQCLRDASPTMIGAAKTAAPVLAADPDPIFAAIELSRQLEAAHGRSFQEAQKLPAEEADEYTATACHPAAAALRELAGTIPRSTAGIRAMACYFSDELDYAEDVPGEVISCMRSIAQSPALAGGEHA